MFYRNISIHLQRIYKAHVFTIHVYDDSAIMYNLNISEIISTGFKIAYVQLINQKAASFDDIQRNLKQSAKKQLVTEIISTNQFMSAFFNSYYIS